MRTAIFAAAMAVLAGTAQAATYTYNFSAEFGGYSITDGDGASTLADTYAAFSTITGTIKFDDTPIGSGSTFSDYAPAILDIDQFNMSEFERLPEKTRLRNDDPVFGDAITTTFQGVGTSDPFGLYDRISLQIIDESQTAFSDTSFPTAIDLADFNIPLILLNSSLKDASGLHTLDQTRYVFTELELVSEVPLPAGIWLLGAGLAGLGTIGRRRRV